MLQFILMFKNINTGILYTTLILIFLGFSIFFSASLSGLKNIEFFTNIFLKQLSAIIIGLFLAFLLLRYRKFSSIWIRKNSIYIFLVTLILQLLVLTPSFGLEYKGSNRWIDLGFISIQPSEIFKYALIIFFSAVVVTAGKKLQKLKNFLILGSLFTIPTIIFYAYIHDFGTLISILLAFFIILLISKSKNWHILLISIIMSLSIGFMAYMLFPYVKNRIDSYFFSADKISYQNKQMLYTIGAGKIVGRGFGASLQKYSGLLPEPLGDSIFPIYAEETGFIGSIILIILFTLLPILIFRKTKKLKRPFDKMIVSGFTILIIFPAFYNISAAIGITPLSGMPITFISKGGTSIVMAIFIMAVILKILKK